MKNSKSISNTVLRFMSEQRALCVKMKNVVVFGFIEGELIEEYRYFILSIFLVACHPIYKKHEKVTSGGC